MFDYNPPKVLVALSGGVDSAYAALWAIKQGYDVTGIYLKLWGGEANGNSCSTSDAAKAAAVAATLDIRLVEVDHTVDFNDRVLGEYVKGMREGRAPNPCLACNKSFKLDWLIDYAYNNGYDFVVTGHYARTVQTQFGVRLAQAVDIRKDQSYVLWMADQWQLSKLMFPCGDLTKDEVKSTMAELGIAEPESMGLCFNPDEVLAPYENMAPLIRDDEVVGEVNITRVVIGQRRGIPDTGGKEPMYVNRISNSDVGRSVHLGRKADLSTVIHDVDAIEWLGSDMSGLALLCQTSSHGKMQDCIVDGEQIFLDSPVQKATPGQAIVLYARWHEFCVVVGGGVAIEGGGNHGSNK